MSLKPLDRLLFTQGQCCFFCRQPLPRELASVEHLLATAHGGSNALDNCVACCQTLNSVFGSMTLKEKMEVLLRQAGQFRCPRQLSQPPSPRESVAAPPVIDSQLVDAAITHLQRRSSPPRTLQSLRQSMSDRFASQLGGISAQALVDYLCLIGVVVPNADGTLTYSSMERSA